MSGGGLCVRSAVRIFPAAGPRPRRGLCPGPSPEHPHSRQRTHRATRGRSHPEHRRPQALQRLERESTGLGARLADHFCDPLPQEKGRADGQSGQGPPPARCPMTAPAVGGGTGRGISWHADLTGLPLGLFPTLAGHDHPVREFAVFEHVGDPGVAPHLSQQPFPSFLVRFRPDVRGVGKHRTGETLASGRVQHGAHPGVDGGHDRAPPNANSAQMMVPRPSQKGKSRTEWEPQRSARWWMSSSPRPRSASSQSSEVR